MATLCRHCVKWFSERHRPEQPVLHCLPPGCPAWFAAHARVTRPAREAHIRRRAVAPKSGADVVGFSLHAFVRCGADATACCHPRGGSHVGGQAGSTREHPGPASTHWPTWRSRRSRIASRYLYSSSVCCDRAAKLGSQIAKKVRRLLHVARCKLHLFPNVGEMLHPPQKPSR